MSPNPSVPAPQEPSSSPDAVLASLLQRVAELEQQVAALSSGTAARPFQTESTGPLPPPLQRLIPAAQIAPPSQARKHQPAGSLENRLGSQVFNRIGIVALLFATSWALKLAIEQGWLGYDERVLVGLGIGGALVLWSERFRRKGFAAFSYSLKAVATGVLYLSLWAAFHLYHLVPAPVALGAMILVTAWNAFMAWSQDSELLAVYALAGAFATPLLLSTGGDHEIFLFSYIASIDFAIAALLRLKPWPRLLLGAFPATVAYFIGWYSSFFSLDHSLILTSTFLLAFFTAFTLPTLRGAPASGRKQKGQELISLFLVFANAAFLSLGLYSVLQDTGKHDLLPWLMVVLAALSLALMRVVFSAAAAGVQLSLAVTFLTIAIPLKASGRWITIGWLAEGIVLLWVAWKLSVREQPAPAAVLPSRILRSLAAGALLLGFVGAVSLPFWLDQQQLILRSFLNQRFATSLVAMAAFALTAVIGSRAARQNPPQDTLWPYFSAGSILSLNLLALQAGILEIETFWRLGHPDVKAAALQSALSISGYLLAYGAVLLAIGFWRRAAFIRWQALVLLIIAIAKTFVYDVRGLSQGYRVASFLGLGIVLMAVSFAYQKDWLNLRGPNAEPVELPSHPSEPRGNPI